MEQTGTSGENQDDDNAAILRTWLEQDDAPCPGCGYNLRLLTTDVCPECGRRFWLQIDNSTSAHFATLIAFITPVLALAVDGLRGVGHRIAVALYLSNVGGAEPSTVSAAKAIVMLPLAIYLYHKRSWFFRQSRATQWSLTALSWLLLAFLEILPSLAG